MAPPVLVVLLALAAPAQKIYSTPSGSDLVVVVDTADDTVSVLEATGAGYTAATRQTWDCALPVCNATVSAYVPSPPGATTWDAISPVGTWKWAGMAMAPNGKMYSCPYSNNFVLVIDPATDTVSFIDSTRTGGTFKWGGIGLGPNGKMYCAPDWDPSILVIDTATDTVSFITSTNWAVPVGNSEWGAIAAGPNGKMYAAPYASAHILVIDTATDTVSFIDTTFPRWTGGNVWDAPNNLKWSAIAGGPNGKMYATPMNHGSVLVIDTATDTVSFINTTQNGPLKWTGMALAPNGKMYAAPLWNHNVLVIDTATDTVSLIDSNQSSLFAFTSFCSADNGKLYSFPNNHGFPNNDHNDVLIFDTNTDTVSYINSTLPAGPPPTDPTGPGTWTYGCATYTSPTTSPTFSPTTSPVTTPTSGHPRLPVTWALLAVAVITVAVVFVC
eukprot:Hpha_TRINITY_DN16209_c1_g9::TRINITY_DN16209_c1_g9_i1::g.13932::m.13932